jgi:hypothetical protein
MMEEMKMTTWGPHEAYRHNKAVDSAAKADLWAKVANDSRARHRGLADHLAKREADAAVGGMVSNYEPPPPFVVGAEPQRRVK